MIRLYPADETTFLDRANVLSNVLSCVVEEEEHGMFSATLEMPVDSRIEEEKIIIADTPRGEQAFRIKKITKRIRKGEKIYQVYARHIFYDLLGNFLENIRPTDATSANALQAILNGATVPHNFTGSSNVPGINTANYVRMNVIQALIGQTGNSLIQRWGGFLKRDNFNIDIQSSSLDRGYEVRLGKNLIGLEQDIDISEVATRIMPTVVIQDNIVTELPEKYLDSPIIGSYANPIVTEYRIDLTDEEKALPMEDIYDLMRDQVALLWGDIDTPKVNYKIDFIELSKTEQYKDISILEQLDISDTITVKVAPMGIDIKSRLIKYTYDGLRGRFISMELGNFKPKLTNTRLDIARTVEKLNQNLLDGEVASRLKDAIDTIIGNKGGYKVELFDEFGIPTGTAYMDTDDVNTAQNYILINNQGIAFGDSGLSVPPNLAIGIDGTIVGDGAFFNSLLTNLIQSDLGQSLDLSSNVAITSKVSQEDLESYVSDATSNLASTAYVDGAIDAINRANPNLISNRSDRWEQGNIVGGALTESAKHIRSQSYFPVRAGSVTMKVSPLYEVALVNYDQDYSYISTSSFATEQTINIPTNSLFKAILRRVGGTEDILPTAIDTAELKVENATEATQWTPYMGDLTLDEQKEFFAIYLSSSNGWTVDTNQWTTTLKATPYIFNEDISNGYPGATIFWYRQYPGEPKALIGSGTTYTVTPSETEKSATYEAVFNLPANKYYIVTKGGDRILTKGGDLILAKVSDDPGISISTSKVLVRDYRDKILSAESSITQMASSIEQKVEQTSYNADKNAIETNITTLTTKVGAVEASIDGATHTFSQTGYLFRDSNGNEIFSLTKGMANEQNITKHDDCENGYPLSIPIHIGASTASIEQVLVKWRNSSFRATAKGAAAGGSNSVTSSSGGGTTVTSGASSKTTSDSGGSSTTTTASGGGHTSGGGGGSTVASGDTLYNVRYSQAVTGYSSNHQHDYLRLAGHTHNVSLPSHTHWVNNHTHSVSIPAHSHGMAHTHSITLSNHAHSVSIPNHIHNLIYGIVEQPVSSNALTVWVDGVQRGSVNAAQGEIDITAYLQTTGWHTVELRTTTLKRIDANIFIKSYIRR